MFQSRDEIRQVYLTVWQKMQHQALLEPMEAVIADVIQLHPEYQGLLAQTDDATQQDYSPDDGQTNPFLHMGMHIALREQAQSNRPLGFTSIYKKLIRRKGQHEAEHAMMECLGQMLWDAQRNNQPPDENAYLISLKNL